MTVKTRNRLIAAACIVAGLGLIAAANVHLVRASLLSQPECVPHLKAPGGNGQFRAAKPSC